MWFKSDEESERLLEKYRKLADVPIGINDGVVSQEALAE